MDGTVKKMNMDKGFGFVRATSGGSDYFFHRSAADWDRLREGDKVTFDEEPSVKGLRAKDVRLKQ